MSDRKEVFLFRHGDVDDRYKKRFRGALDVALSPLGEKMSRVNARFLASGSVDLVITTGLQRTDLVGKLAAELGVPHRIDRRFREAQFGDWEGKSWDEVQSLYPEESATYKRDFLQMKFPNGESVVELRARLEAAWKEVLQLPESRIAIIGHSTGNGCLMAAFKKVTFAEAGMQLLGSFHDLEAVAQKVRIRRENVVLFDSHGDPLSGE